MMKEIGSIKKNKEQTTLGRIGYQSDRIGIHTQKLD